MSFDGSNWVLVCDTEIDQYSKPQIEKYVKKNKSAVFSSVGSYKIEENDKFKLVEILSGDKETIFGFPFNEFLKSNKNE